MVEVMIGSAVLSCDIFGCYYI